MDTLPSGWDIHLLLVFHFQFSSVAQSCPALYDPMDFSMPGFPVHHQLLGLAQTHDHRVGDAIQPSHSLLSPSPAFSPKIRVFSKESVLRIRGTKYWSFSISPSNEYSGLISFRIDWFDLFEVQGTLKSLLQHHSSKASILQCSAFFMVQLSHPYMTTGKTKSLTRQTFVGKAMSLLFNMLFSVQFSSVAQSCPTLCDPMNRSMPGLPVHHQLPEFTQTHVHRVSDAIQPSHPLSSLYPPPLNLFQHQGLFKCQLFISGGQSIGVSASTSVLPKNT